MTLAQIFAAVMAAILLSAASPSSNAMADRLTSFLESKGSPLPAQELLLYANWRMIVALSAAESGYGKYRAGTYNAWGIKDYQSGSPKYGGTRDFASWEESIKYTSELLYKYDAEDGEPDAWEMVRTWKYVLPYGHWVNNVNYALADIEANVVADPTAPADTETPANFTRA